MRKWKWRGGRLDQIFSDGVDEQSMAIQRRPCTDYRNFHDSARALASCLQKRDVSRKTDQIMIEAAKLHVARIAGGGE